MTPEIIEEIKSLCEGKSVDEIEDMLVQSKHIDRIQNPQQVAAYIAQMCSQ